MKLIYLFVLLCSVFTFSNAQSDKQRSKRIISPDEKKEILSNLKSNASGNQNIGFQKTNAGNCDSLLVKNLSDNGAQGNMFDIQTIHKVTLQTFSMDIETSPLCNAAIFYRTGTFVGHETSATGWIFLDSAKVKSTTDVLTKIPVNLNLTLNANATYAFYVTVTASNAFNNYTDGSFVGKTIVNDGNIIVKEGNGSDYPFSGNYSPRIFNGKVYYCTDGVGVDDNSSEIDLNIYPNPVTNILQIQTALTVNTITVSDITGRILNVSASKNVDCSGFGGGVYFVTVETEKGAIVKKFVKD